jgi:hypothetical protein
LRVIDRTHWVAKPAAISALMLRGADSLLHFRGVVIFPIAEH